MCSSEREREREREKESELGDCDTVEHRDTAWRAGSPSGGLIFRTGGPTRPQCEHRAACGHM